MFSCLCICFSCFSVFLFVLPYPCNVCSFSLLCFKFVLQDLFIFLLPCSSPLLQQQQQEQQKQQQEQQDYNKHIKNNQNNQTRTRTKLLAAVVSILFFRFFALVKRPWRDHEETIRPRKGTWNVNDQVSKLSCLSASSIIYIKEDGNSTMRQRICKMEGWSLTVLNLRAKWKIETPKVAFTIQHGKLKFQNAEGTVQNNRLKWGVGVPKCCKYNVQNIADTMCHERFCLQNVARHAHAMQNARFYLQNEGWSSTQIRCKLRFQQAVTPKKIKNLPTYYPPTIPHLLCRWRQKIPRKIWVPRRWLRWSLLWSAAEAVDAPRPRSQVESVHHVVNARVLLGISWNLLLWQSMTHIPSHSKTPCFQWSFRSFLLDCLPQWSQFLILAVLSSHRGLRWPRRLGHSGDSSKNRTIGELMQEAQHLDAMMTQSISHRIHGAAIYGNIYHQYTPNVSIYTIHGSYGYRGVLAVIVEIQRGQVWGLGCGMLWLWPSSVLVQAASSLRKGPCAPSLTGTLNSWKILKGSLFETLLVWRSGEFLGCGFMWLHWRSCTEILLVHAGIWIEIWWVLSRDPWGFCWHREVKRGVVFFDHWQV